MENKRRKSHTDLESVPVGYANGVAPGFPFTDREKQKMIKQHNKLRLNKEAIKQSIEYHNDYHIKPVLDKDLTMVGEVEEFLKDLEIPDHKVWAMPAGDDRESLMESYGPVMNFVRDRGWRFTGRAHIMAFNTERCV